MLKQSSSTKFEAESIKSSLWDYFDTFILVTRDITVAADNNTHVAFTYCEQVSTFLLAINDLFKQKSSTKLK